MGRRLNTYVHVNHVAYGPDDEVPDEIAALITAPGVWAEEASDTAADVSGTETDDVAGPGRPSNGASKAAWVAYAVAMGMDADEADTLSRDALVARFPAE